MVEWNYMNPEFNKTCLPYIDFFWPFWKGALVVSTLAIKKVLAHLSWGSCLKCRYLRYCIALSLRLPLHMQYSKVVRWFRWPTKSTEQAQRVWSPNAWSHGWSCASSLDDWMTKNRKRKPGTSESTPITPSVRDIQHWLVATAFSFFLSYCAEDTLIQSQHNTSMARR